MTSATAPLRALLPVVVDVRPDPVLRKQTRPLTWRLAQLKQLDPVCR